MIRENNGNIADLNSECHPCTLVIPSWLCHSLRAMHQFPVVIPKRNCKPQRAHSVASGANLAINCVRGHFNKSNINILKYLNQSKTPNNAKIMGWLVFDVKTVSIVWIHSFFAQTTHTPYAQRSTCVPVFRCCYCYFTPWHWLHQEAGIRVGRKWLRNWQSRCVVIDDMQLQAVIKKTMSTHIRSEMCDR